MRIIVAIGGGEIGRTKKLEDGSIKTYPVETTSIDRQIVQMTGKKSLFPRTKTLDKSAKSCYTKAV